MGSTLWQAWDTGIRIVSWTVTGRESTIYDVVNTVARWLS